MGKNTGITDNLSEEECIAAYASAVDSHKFVVAELF